MALGENTIGGRVRLDTDQFENGIAGINRSLKRIDAEFRNTSEQLRGVGSEMDQLENKTIHLNQKIEAQTQKMKHYEQALRNSQQKQQEMRQKCEQLATSMQQLEKEIQQSTQAYGKNAQETKQLQERYGQLQQEYKQGTQALQRLTAQVSRNDTAFHNASAALHRFRNELGDTRERMDQLSNVSGRVRERMNEIGNSMQETGTKISQGFGAAAVGVSAGIGALVVNAGKFEEANKKVQAGLGLTKEESLKVSEVAKAVWRDGYGEDLESVSDSLVKVKRNIKGINDDDTLKQVTRDSEILAETMESDVNEVTRGASQLMDRFGESSEKSFDMLAQASAKGLNYSGELFDNLSEYGPLFDEMGFQSEEMFNILINGSQNGAYNLDYVNDVVKEFGIRIKNGSKLTKESMSQLSESTQKVWKAMLDGKATSKDVFNSVLNDLKAMGNTVDANAIGVGLFGVKWEDLEYKTMTSLNNMETGIGDYSGAMNKMVDGYDTSAKQWKSVTRELQIALEPLGKVILDIAKQAIPELKESIKGVADWFNGLDDSSKKVYGTALLLAPAVMGVVGALGMLSFALGAIIANPIVAIIGGVVIGLGALGFALADLNEKTNQTQSNISKFGQNVSDATSKAAGAYVDLKDKAIHNMMDLKQRTGEEANKAADETIQAFQRMTNEVIKELEGKKSDFNKMFSQLMGTVPESAKSTLEQVKNNVIESINKEIEVATQAEKILEEGIKRYQGDTMKMPKDFAQKFEQALQVADKNVQQFYTKAKEITSISKEIEAGGMLSLDAGKKRFESIIKVYEDGVKSLEKQTKGWRENVEKAFKLGEIKPEERKATLDAIALYESKHVNDLQSIRNDGFKILQQHMKEEDSEVLASQAKRMEAEDKGWGERFKAAYGFREKSADLEQRFRSDQEKAEKDYQDKLLQYELQYGKSKIESIGMYLSELQKGTESSRLLAESMAKEIDGKMKIDLGPAGQFTIDTFLQKLQKGELDSSAIAIANANKLKEVYKVDLSQSGMESMQKWIEGIKTKDTGEVREFLSENMQGNTTIDLGIYGQMTMDSWITGLQTGTLSFDTVFQFFQQNVKNGMNVDATQEGQNNIQTLVNGMQIGALSLPQVAQTMGLDIKSNVQVDLGEAGQFNVQTLVQGMQNGSINAELAAKAIALLVENGAKLDLTHVGFDISQTQANGIASNTAPENAATGKKQVVEGVMGSTTDGGGGSKSGSELGQGIMSQDGYIRGNALHVVASAHGAFGTINGNPSGNQGGQGVASGIVNQNGHIRGSALEAVASAHGGFNTINGTPQGEKGGGQFAQGMENTKGQAKSSGSNVAESGNSGLESVSSISPGEAFSKGFASGISNGDWSVRNVAASLARGAFEALKATLDVNSPSKLTRDQGGMPFGEGFALGIQKSAPMAEKESRSLALQANSALVNGLDKNEHTFAGVRMAKGIAVGIKSQYSVVRDALQDTVSGAMDGIRSISPDQLFSLKGDDPLSSYFNAIFEDGDWQNDWVTHLPDSMREMILNIGKQVERFEGLSQMDIGSLGQWRKIVSNNTSAAQYRQSESQGQFQGKASEARIEIPIYLEGREIARVAHPYVTEYQNREKKRNAAF